MTKTSLVFVTLLSALFFPTAAVHAQETEMSSHEPRRWAFEIDLLQPLVPTVHVIRPKFSYTLWGHGADLRGDLLVGAFIRPHIEHDIVETIDEYMLTLGYRQYLWKGLHLEAGALAGYAWGTNKFDGKDYQTPTLFFEVNAGYRLGFFEPGGLLADRGKDSARFFITPQVGFIWSSGVSSIGPRNGMPDYFVQGQLLIGRTF